MYFKVWCFDSFHSSMANFKFLAVLATGYLSSLVLAAPTATINHAKRASISDAAHGYASLNGGTSGGAGGTTTTVSSYSALASAVSGDDAKIVYIDGNIKEATDQVKVGSNTSIIGKDSKAVLEGFGL